MSWVVAHDTDFESLRRTIEMSGILELAGDFYCNISKEGAACWV
jgi:hypothetical protein